MTNSSFSSFPAAGGSIGKCVLPLIAMVDDEFFPVGTGFVVNRDGLIVTAAHVLEAAASMAVRRLGDDGSFRDLYGFYALYVSDQINADGTTFGGLIPIDHVWAPTGLDIGFGFLRLPIDTGTGRRLPLLLLPIRPAAVAVGSPIIALGYYQMGSNVSLEDDRSIVEYQQNTAVARGTVLEVHPEYRDRAYLSFPCFLTDARFDPGMSGGPILTEDGKVCGVVCSGTQFEPSENGFISYGSLIWPMFGCYIEVARDSSSSPERTLMYDLAAQGLILTDETLSHIKVEALPSGERSVRLRVPRHQ